MRSGQDPLRDLINTFFPYLMLLPAIILVVDLWQHGLDDFINIFRIVISLLLFFGGSYIIFERVLERVVNSSSERRYQQLVKDHHSK